ncbi:MAG TPA: P-loop NTPase [Mesorhizobium sp.]
MTVLMPTTDSVTRSLIGHEPPQPFDSGPDELDLSAGLRLLRRRIGMIAAITGLLTLACIPLILGLKPTYHAESRLMIYSPLASTLGTGDAGQGSALNINSETERLYSRPIAQRVIADLGLADLEEFNPALREASILGKLRNAMRGLVDGGAAAAGDSDGIERIIPEYYQALNIRRDGVSDVIQIGFNSRDPKLAAAVPNKILGVYLDEREAGTKGRFSSAEEWIRQRLADQKARVNAAREAAARYGKAVGAVSNDAQAEQIRAVADLNGRSAKIVQGKAELAATISALEAAGSDGDIGKIAVPEGIGSLQRDLRALDEELDQLLLTYGNNAEEVIDQRAKISKAKTDLNFEIGRYLQAQRAKLAGFSQQERSVKSALVVAREQLSRSTTAQTELTHLVRVADMEQAAFDKLEDQNRALVAQAALPAVEVEMLSPATVPLQPQGRGRLFYLIGAMLAAISIATTVAILREMMDKSVRSHEQLQAIADIVPVGQVPALSERAGKTMPMVFGDSEGGVFAEAVRSMIMALKQVHGGKLPQSIMVTSAHGGEGKTLIARSLAIELVASGHKVLLVDGDLRGGDLGTLFKSGVKVGLNEFLTGQAGLGDIVYHHAKSGIDFIPRGNPSLNRRPHLPDMQEIVKLAKENGQILVLDSASLLSSTDTVYLASLAERSILVVQWAQTTHRAVEAAAQRLRNIRRSEILIAINNINIRRHALYGFKDSEMFMDTTKRFYAISA